VCERLKLIVDELNLKIPELSNEQKAEKQNTNNILECKNNEISKLRQQLIDTIKNQKQKSEAQECRHLNEKIALENNIAELMGKNNELGNDH
jgi:predicted transcriptional regulator